MDDHVYEYNFSYTNNSNELSYDFSSPFQSYELRVMFYVRLSQHWSKQSEANHFVFYCHPSPRPCVYLVVYVDDKMITRNDANKISRLKRQLFNHFQTKDLVCLKYFLSIEVAQSK